jgi:hypothetical protein
MERVEYQTSSGWQGATLRPTGVVVFATLDRASTGPAVRRQGGADLRVESGPLGRVRTASGAPRGAHTSAQQLRARASRGFAWLLGR